MEDNEEQKIEWYVYFIRGLVAVMILLFLWGVVFGSAIGCGPPAREINTINTAVNLKTAITAFYTEYDRYPLGDRNSKNDITSDSAGELMNILMALDGGISKASNPRRIVFFTGKKARKKWFGPYTKGIKLSTDGKSAELLDYWGNLYRVKLDSNGDNRITNPGDPKTDASELPESVLVWSAGADVDFATWKDNVKTWWDR